MSDIIKTQRSLARKATHHRTHQFEDLYRLICREEWIRTALNHVLSNQGARTAGIDGVTKKALMSETARAAFVLELQAELRQKRFRPVPVRRVYIPKSNDKLRPLGIPTLKDRVVQMLLKMVLEPIWESNFLNCSNGFRPGRRTMDCIARLDSYVNNRNKYYWVIEGDIKGAFDNIHHEILLKLLAQRIADQRLLNLVDRFLKAGMMEGSLFKSTEVGIPQGGICSPLLANIYLHQLDLFWWNKYGCLDRKEKERRRIRQQGNCALIRYADDWLILTNGSKAEALRLRDEIQTFLREELHLELSVEKTHVTHVNDGFDFLGFHVRRYTSRNDRPKLLVTPSQKAVTRLKAKIKEMTARKRFRDKPLLKFSALNAVLRGWINYFRYSNAKGTAKDLDFWVNERLFLWLQKRHRLPPKKIIDLYKQREHGTRDNWGIRNGETTLYLYRMSDQPITKYRSRNPPNLYLAGEWVTTLNLAEAPQPEIVWLGNAENNEEWRELKEEIKAERGAKCDLCGSRENLDLHHLQARRYGGKAHKENLQLLCRSCHTGTETFGDHSRLQ
ncbi:reverse transcriptase (plasmid) [Leptolyngbya boryana NIES-2135]|jgi:RNA-directed DNA polymerase|uniref:Reverse transcriptase n=1 Tax=Leptolyngbya boryana NIES-2135 TaxID=1973484 RepID=A0A1Z4JR73_LEPBY|nr:MULTISPECIES: group II intron reverse transcriptase/maturase [Leptolyngbya]BAY59167.1 reverse transcriptase [Leptolyngbya boryana NIES-2135]MBD2372754.1 group II intron reverse transcriptase/maturase [Leptolyngbya sp. FACHB-238]MBD2397494.1 group II intron reverse transcriptase/maturase [Leptolyngbya sp. FACHB-239]MBD2403701.1 group II intron reverse transcriptase/maturase [Leptolyngbya sp. FACHB-402]ULP33360.1 group II intron reverse transcriptase/maturase [Leptolyngbya boryana IU 594]